MIRTAWSVDPAIATHMAERFKRQVVENELTRLLRSNPSVALHVPEAVKFFIGDRFSRHQKRDHKVSVYIIVRHCRTFICVFSCYWSGILCLL